MRNQKRAVRFSHEWPILTREQPPIDDLKMEARAELELGAKEKGYRILAIIFATEHGAKPKLHAQATAVKI